MVGWSLWISSINRTSPFSRLVKRPASSPAFSITGPLVFLILTFIAFAMMNASVVLPRPDGPLSKMCSSTSPRFFAASTINSKRSRTFTWPVNSLNIGGRSEISNAASGSGGFIWSHSFLIQILRQHELGPARFVKIINLVESAAHQLDPAPPGFWTSRAELVQRFPDWFAIVAQAHADATARRFHRQSDGPIVAHGVGVANDVGAGLVHAEHDQSALPFGKWKIAKKFAHEAAHHREVGGVTGELEFAFFHRPEQRWARFGVQSSRDETELDSVEKRLFSLAHVEDTDCALSLHRAGSGAGTVHRLRRSSRGRRARQSRCGESRCFPDRHARHATTADLENFNRRSRPRRHSGDPSA